MTELYMQYHAAHPLMCSVYMQFAGDKALLEMLAANPTAASFPAILQAPIDRLAAYPRLLKELDRYRKFMLAFQL